MRTLYIRRNTRGNRFKYAWGTTQERVKNNPTNAVIGSVQDVLESVIGRDVPLGAMFRVQLSTQPFEGHAVALKNPKVGGIATTWRSYYYRAIRAGFCSELLFLLNVDKWPRAIYARIDSIS